MRQPSVPPLLVLGFGILAVSTSSIMIRFAQRGATSMEIAAWRLLLASLALAPIALTRRRAELRSLDGRQGGLAILSGLFLALHFATWITSLAYTSVASSVVLVSTAPLWVALLSPIALKEPLSRPMLTGMLLALVGSAIVGISDTCTLSGSGLACPDVRDFLHGRAFVGDMLALIGAISAAGYLIIGRRLRAQLSLLGYIFVVYGMAAVALVAAVLISGQTLFGYAPLIYVWLLGLALIPQLIGHTSYNWALAYLSAAYVSIAVLGEPVGSSILAYFLFDEQLTSLKIFGAALTLAGIYVSSRSETRKGEPIEPPDSLPEQPLT